METASFNSQVQNFMQSICDLLEGCLVGDLSERSMTLASSDSLRAQFGLTKELRIKGAPLAMLLCQYRLCPNSTGNHLAIENSTIQLQYKAKKKPVPIVRFEYDRNPHSMKPSSHFHFHADSVPLGLFLYGAAGRAKAADQSKIHFPTGDARFRVTLEDVVELVIREFEVDSHPGWEELVSEGRANFQRIQVDTVIRKNRSRAAEILAEYE